MEVPHSSNSNKKRKDKRESFWNKEYFYADIWFDAARDGNLATIQHYLDGGWDVNMQDKPEHRETDPPSKYTALHFAAEHGHIEIVKLLLEHGADVNVKASDEFGKETALHLAAKNGHLEIVKLLLEHGAKINTKTSDGHETALHFAAQQRHIEIVKLLLEHGADVNVKTTYDETAVGMAKLMGNMKVFGFISQWLEQKLNLDPNN